ncbi:hypothetical protein ABW21_db0208879 [Orbilia brochopaga]|nr:hypothetical protein ABW21_db0208879 [Drechslerella brochopaga]
MNLRSTGTKYHAANGLFQATAVAIPKAIVIASLSRMLAMYRNFTGPMSPVTSAPGSRGPLESSSSKTGSWARTPITHCSAAWGSCRHLRFRKDSWCGHSTNSSTAIQRALRASLRSDFSLVLPALRTKY